MWDFVGTVCGITEVSKILSPEAASSSYSSDDNSVDDGPPAAQIAPADADAEAPPQPAEPPPPLPPAADDVPVSHGDL